MARAQRYPGLLGGLLVFLHILLSPRLLLHSYSRQFPDT